MNSFLEKSIGDLSRFFKFGEEEMRILSDVDAAAEEIRPVEVESYLKREVNLEVFTILSRHKLSGMPVSKKYGGRDANPLVSALAFERLGQVYVGLGAITSMALCAKTIEDWGTEYQKERYVLPVCRGESILGFALTEPEAGSHIDGIKCRYEERGGHYVLNGTKYLVTNGVIADALITFARSSESNSITAFIVDKKSKGLTATPLKEKMGGFTSDLGLVEFDQVEVAKENVLGPLDGGKKVAYSAFMGGRLRLAAVCLGVMEDCLSSSVERVKERVTFGKVLGKQQLIQEHIAQMVMNLEASRWLCYNAAFRLMDWEKDRKNLTLRRDADQAVVIAKRMAAEYAWNTADRAVQIFGGFGYSIMSSPTRHLLNVRVARIGEGTDEILSLKIAAEILGKEFESY
ncbi:MAG: acyl-CoA/acyl-ACP dehydrogenase [Thaumarchaeota archaeon]|nr:acyl-CoA/acyl-ACP dehydrogenase [Nitrososphaerota archaeon]MCS4540134.1 acyl-CoA/acyl-ACP dehydrogenase [Nitrososphaerota archaeon]